MNSLLLALHGAKVPQPSTKATEPEEGTILQELGPWQVVEQAGNRTCSQEQEATGLRMAMAGKAFETLWGLQQSRGLPRHYVG